MVEQKEAKLEKVVTPKVLSIPWKKTSFGTIVLSYPELGDDDNYDVAPCLSSKIPKHKNIIRLPAAAASFFAACLLFEL